MRFQYSKVKTGEKTHPVSFVPLINVKIGNGSKSVVTRSLIDSGADINLINAQFAKLLGLDYKTGVKVPLKGIVNQKIEAFVHEVDFEIPRLTTESIKMKFGFIDSSTVGVLLGQEGFFDNFRVAFEKHYNFFEIELSK
jgi:hypothetical protein